MSWPVGLSGLECLPVHQKVMGSIPSQGTCLGLVPSWGTYERQLIDVSLSHR